MLKDLEKNESHSLYPRVNAYSSTALTYLKKFLKNCRTPEKHREQIHQPHGFFWYYVLVGFWMITLHSVDNPEGHTLLFLLPVCVCDNNLPAHCRPPCTWHLWQESPRDTWGRCSLTLEQQGWRSHHRSKRTFRLLGRLRDTQSAFVFHRFSVGWWAFWNASWIFLKIKTLSQASHQLHPSPLKEEVKYTF